MPSLVGTALALTGGGWVHAMPETDPRELNSGCDNRASRMNSGFIVSAIYVVVAEKAAYVILVS